MNKMIIGSLSACIAGDTRYTDVLRVEWNDDDSVTVAVYSTMPVGGMDGPGGVHDLELRANYTLQTPSAKSVMLVIKTYINQGSYSFKRYGVPSKRFSWPGVGVGLSTKLCSDALARMCQYNSSPRPREEK